MKKEHQQLQEIVTVKKKQEKKRLLWTMVGVLFIAVLVVSSRSSNKGISGNQTATRASYNSQMSLVSGGWMIVSPNDPNNNYGAEGYALDANGNATWFFISAAGKQEKSGTWSKSGDGNTITTRIRGNSGLLTESYKKRNGTYYRTDGLGHYLKKTQ